MKLVMTQHNLAKAVNLVGRIVSNRATLPVLSNILITAKKGSISFSSTDLEIGITTHVVGKVEADGELTVPARLLADFINNNNDPEIILETTDMKMTLKSARFTAEIIGISAEEFPTVPEPPKDMLCSLPKDHLVDALKRVIIAPANDETRPTLAGIYCKFSENELVLAATDSYRLAEKRLKLDSSIEDKHLIVPTRTIAEVLRLSSAQEDVGEVGIITTENQIFFKVGETSLVSRLIEGVYPNYSQIIPPKFKISVEADYKELVTALKMAALFAKDSANNIKISVEQEQITIASALTENGNAKSVVAAVSTGGTLDISFNAKYLLDMLQVVSANKIIFKLNDGQTAAVLATDADEHYQYIVMPLRIDA